MKLYLVDDTEGNVDPEFDAALFVVAETPERAAYLWENHYERDSGVARVTLVPFVPNLLVTEGAIDWGRIIQLTITI